MPSAIEPVKTIIKITMKLETELAKSLQSISPICLDIKIPTYTSAPAVTALEVNTLNTGNNTSDTKNKTATTMLEKPVLAPDSTPVVDST